MFITGYHSRPLITEVSVPKLSRAVYWLLVTVLLSSIFYDNPQVVTWKKILYSLFLYASIIQLYFIWANSRDRALPKALVGYLVAVLVFIFVNLIITLFKGGINLVTLFNNPFALLSSLPLFAIPLGYFITESHMRQLLRVTCAIFLFSFVIAIFFKEITPAYVCASAVIPALIFEKFGVKSALIAAILIFCSCAFSAMSGFRIIILKLVYFGALFVPFYIFRNVRIVKVAILVTLFLITYQVVINLEDLLTRVGSFFHLSSFDVTDTRSFLYDEVFSDLGFVDIVFGRGYLGTYFSSYFYQLQRAHNYEDYFERFTIEVGYLELLLKGGVLYVVLYLAPLFFASLKSLLQRGNSVRNIYLGLYLLGEAIMFFFENVPYYSFQMFLSFLLAGYLIKRLNAA